MLVTGVSEGEALHVVGDQIRPILAGAQFEVFDSRGPVGSGPPPHAHPWDEGYIVVAGAISVGGDAGEERVGAGRAVHIEGGATHWYRIEEPDTSFLVITGGRGAVRFFRDMDATVGPGLPTESTMPTIIEVARRNSLTSPLF